MPTDLTTECVRAALTGPIASIRTPFNRNGSIDFTGLRTILDFHYDAGYKVALLTAGDSLFSCLTDQEIYQLNRAVAEYTAGRIMTVAADWEFATPQAIAFAEFCASIGVDMLMARPPDWMAASTEQSLLSHYSAIAERIPLMLVTNIFQGRERFGLNVIQACLQQVPRMLAVKEDLTGDFARKAALIAHPSCAVFSGGGLRNHLNMHFYGCDGFMDRHMNFAPEVSRRYWAGVQNNDAQTVRTIIRDIEIPLEDFMGEFPGGRDAAMHGLLEIHGLAGRWRRPPFHSLTDDEMARLKNFLLNICL